MTAIEACISYVLAAIQLIKSGSAEAAFEKAKNYVLTI
jgi:hypothetical protein